MFSDKTIETLTKMAGGIKVMMTTTYTADEIAAEEFAADDEESIGPLFIQDFLLKSAPSAIKIERSWFDCGAFGKCLRDPKHTYRVAKALDYLMDVDVSFLQAARESCEFDDMKDEDLEDLLDYVIEEIHNKCA
jgi:hypothetical protein